MKRFSILIVDDEDLIRESLVEYLSDTYDVTGASSGEEAWGLLRQKEFDLVMSDIRMPGIDGFELLRRIGETFPATKTALITAYNVDNYVKLAREKGITNIIAKETPFNYDELSQTSHNLLTGEFFGLYRYLDEDALIRTITLRDTEMIQASIAQVIEFFSTIRDHSDILDTCDLLLDELLHNAMIHAPRDKQGRVKYSRSQDVILEDNECVTCDYGYDQRKFGFGIVDNFGTLDNTKVMDLLDRHISGEGYHDRQGRGLFISRGLTDRFIINIRREVRTEIICLFYLQGDHPFIKPLCINQI